MPSAGGTSRTKRNVFDRLDGENESGIFGGPRSQSDLQYPDSLGGDEYNQFVLFSMFDKKNSEISSLEKEISGYDQEINTLLQSELSLIADELSEILGIDSETGMGYVKPAMDLILRGGATVAGALSAVLAPASGVVAGAANILTFGLLPEQQGNFNEIIGGPKYLQLQDRIRQAESKLSIAKDKFSTSIGTKSEAQIDQFLSDRSEITIANAKDQGLNIKSRSAGGISRTRLSPASEKIDSTIALYIPNKIVNNGSISYNNVDFAAARAASDLVINGDVGGGAFLARRKLLSVVDSLGSLVGADINAEAAAQAVTGMAINPRQEMLFNQVAARSFDFSFSFAPRNKKEASEVAEIIRTFRKYSHPSTYGAGSGLNVPAEFEIRYYKVFNNDVTAENLFLNKIGRCALTGINVDFTPNGVMSTFPDGSPVRTALTMSFQELRPLTREDIEEGY